MRNATPDGANVIASPTVIFAGVLVLEFGLDMFWPAPFLPEGWGFPLGLIVIFAAVNIKLFAAREMIRVKTNLNIRKPATDIATSGLYSVTRNPLYRHHLAQYRHRLHRQFVVDSSPLRRTCGNTAKRRDRAGRGYLEQKFGDKYLRYKAKVRRWI